MVPYIPQDIQEKSNRAAEASQIKPIVIREYMYRKRIISLFIRSDKGWSHIEVADYVDTFG